MCFQSSQTQKEASLFLHQQFDAAYLKQLHDRSAENRSFFFRTESDLDSGSRRIRLSWLPVSIGAAYNNSFILSQNDEQLLPSGGLQGLFAAGLKCTSRYADVQLAPRISYLHSINDNVFPVDYSDRMWIWYYDEIKRIDRPYQFSNSARFFPGNSYVKLKAKGLSAGVSSASTWIGPGYFNSLVMTSTAPGIPHFFLKTEKPINLKWLRLEFSMLGGLMHRSQTTFPQRILNNIAPLQDSTGAFFDRYLNAFSLTVSPAGWKNLYLGLSRVVYSNYDQFRSVKDLFPTLIAGRDPTALATVFDQRDQMLVISYRILFPASHFELYGEFGRNDYFKNMRDFIMSPDHSAAYIAGFKKAIHASSSKPSLLNVEFAKLEGSLSYSVLYRGQEGWYRHNQVTKGYTNYGQIIGAGIGTGSNAFNAAYIRFKNKLPQTRVSFSYIWNNNDFLNNAFRQNADKSPWTGLHLNYSRQINPGPSSAFTIKIGILSELNRFWIRQASAEIPGLTHNGWKSSLRPILGINYTYKLN